MVASDIRGEFKAPFYKENNLWNSETPKYDIKEKFNLLKVFIHVKLICNSIVTTQPASGGVQENGETIFLNTTLQG